ncbi:pentatricopeptide repeat-containing protein At1g53600, mitochondrial-like [Durio zibethinus]|uniref:Pentatricopeptide repeat-containing protein At1g53600, mitochondrial-like n=1 Tax=Durio zibethinus TaxID=66656 RepID=A0A6P6A4X9_DURZI|nr:pentatricopeptide repeat-containing protein At1g53600, mitochondrial-like [Durio zibethinus]
MRASKRTPILSLKIARYLCTLSTSNLDNDINNCLQKNRLNKARKIFEQNPNAGYILSWNAMINPNLRNGQAENAHDLFDEVTLKNPASWNNFLSGLKKSQNPEGVYKCFLEMVRFGLKPTEYTILILVNAVSETKFTLLVPQIHGLVVCLGLNMSMFVGSALMKWYARIGDVEGVGRVFDEILVKNVACWNALISGYMEVGYFKQARRVFDKMPERDIVSWTSLINGYIRNKWINRARSMFNKMSEKNVVSWTVMINGYVQSERFREALKLFVLMLRSETRPNQFTFSSVLNACAGCSYLVTGQLIHSSILKFGIPEDLILSASSVDMYAKCGDIGAAFCIFESMREKNLVSWNSLIGGYARQGLGRRALEEFDRMINTGVWPNQVTIFNVLLACRNSGLVEEGERHFNSMDQKYGIQAGLEHYACMMEIYGKTGQLDKADKLIKGMFFKFDVVVWCAFVRAFYLHSGLEPSELATEGILKLKMDYPLVYSAFRKIHGVPGTVTGVTEFRPLKEMKKKRKIAKQKALSRIESPVKVI